MSFQTWSQTYFRIPIFYRLLLTMIFFMLLFGITIHIIEPTHFPTIFDGVWWAFVTGSTVGYGDYVPLTAIGKVVGILLILAGGGVVTFYMATVSAGTLKREHDLSKGTVAYKGKNHIMLIGWNERTRQLIDMIERNKSHEKIVIIDASLKELPIKRHHVHFIRGSGSQDEILRKANLLHASTVIITSDPSKKEEEADQLSILMTVAVRGSNPNITVITEILTKEQVTNAKRAGADSVIRSNDFMSTLFFHELYRTEPVKPFDIMLAQFSSQQYHELDLPDELNGKSFIKCSNEFVKKDELLLGIRRKGELWINPPFAEIIETGDHLILLSSLRQ